MTIQLASAIVVGDGVDGGVVLRGPKRSKKWNPGMVFFEVEMPDKRMRQIKFKDTERVEVR